AISFNDPGFDNRSTLRVLLECTAVTAPVSTVERALATTSTISAANDAIANQVLDIVADKTGYPADMLDVEMDLEAELGIDSIKQVEILSAL
ncbi:phosphopantetheine-binding protein, partial [Yoonia sp. R2-816]|uniref:phosphopantetheine-binding protein n=1 Tax=Yoonia sp. R2-816 TaxID=3342638 RepID=UPI00372A93DC